MPIITLNNGKKYTFHNPICTIDIANNISDNLAKSCIAGQINGILIGIFDLIYHDSELIFITKFDKLGFNIIKCSCIHLLGCVIKQLWPNTKIVSSLITHEGFYYDIDINYILTKEDLIKIEKRIHELIIKNCPIFLKKTHWKQAYNLFSKEQEEYKIEYLKKYNENDFINLCYCENYIDICDSLHVPYLYFCNFFVLKDIYKINYKNGKLLQRIYCLVWNTKELFNRYLENTNKIIEYDHRRIGKLLDLYHIEENTPGAVFWHNNGLIIFHELEAFMRLKLKEYQYQEVKSPIMMDSIVWKKTGHWDYYSEYIFTTFSEDKEYCIKPMNCPGHIKIFNQGLKSYKDLPIRIAEFGYCHRNEQSGSLHGLMRLRSFTQDDAHIFCTKNQLSYEINMCIKMMYDIYYTFNFKLITVKISTKPEKYIGDSDSWNWAEDILSNALIKNNVQFEYQIGKGAFYGPKIEFTLLDCLNRTWQCGTIQLDFFLPKLLKTVYIDHNNKRVTPIIIHRAILGSIERFIGIITEEYKGYFPIWLAPIQVIVLNITDNQSTYVCKLVKKLKFANIRAESDLRNEKIGFKIREHTLKHIPYLFICGDQEIKKNQVSVRTCKGYNLGLINIDEIILKLQNEIHKRNFNLLEESKY